MNYTLPDGTTVEIGYSGRVGGPDSQSDLNYGMTYLYWRINKGGWEKAPFRSAHKLTEWIELSENLEDLRGLLPNQ